MTIGNNAVESLAPTGVQAACHAPASVPAPAYDRPPLSPLLRAYYTVKPYIPRRVQIHLRRTQVRYKRRISAASWPLCPAAAARPDNWFGWPEQRPMALVLTHDVEGQRGLARVEATMRLEQSYGFRSSFNFVPERSAPSPRLLELLRREGFEVGVHGLRHDGRLLQSHALFEQRATQINHYLDDWQAVGFRAPSMHSHLPWFHALQIEYDLSTFCNDPFEPLASAASTIFPFWVANPEQTGGYVELPYTLTQDHTLFVLLQEQDTTIWQRQIDWVAAAGGMILVNTHPDYMDFEGHSSTIDEYPIDRYAALLDYLKAHYADRCWHALPTTVAQYCREQWRGHHP